MDFFNNMTKFRKAIIVAVSLFALIVIPGSVGLIISGLIVFVVYSFFTAQPTRVSNHDVDDYDSKPEHYEFNQTSSSGGGTTWTDYDENIHNL